MIDIDGEPWFVAKDVVDALSLKSVAMSLQNINPIEVQDYRIPGTRGRPNKIVSESGLYKMIMRSDKPEAEWFLCRISERLTIILPIRVLPP